MKEYHFHDVTFYPNFFKLKMKNVNTFLIRKTQTSDFFPVNTGTASDWSILYFTTINSRIRQELNKGKIRLGFWNEE